MKSLSNKQNLLLSVIMVLAITLSVVGGSFAYLTATVSSNANSVNASGYKFAGTVTVTRVAPSSTSQLIPLKEKDSTRTGITGAVNASSPCVWSGYNACVIYKVDFKNTGTASAKVYYSIKSRSNTFTNLVYQDLSGTAGSYTLNGNAISIPKSSTSKYNTNVNNITVNASATDTRYFVIYIKDTGANQDVDANMAFAGEIIVTNQSGSQLAASF